VAGGGGSVGRKRGEKKSNLYKKKREGKKKREEMGRRETKPPHGNRKQPRRRLKLTREIRLGKIVIARGGGGLGDKTSKNQSAVEDSKIKPRGGAEEEKKLTGKRMNS